MAAVSRKARLASFDLIPPGIEPERGGEGLSVPLGVPTIAPPVPESSGFGYSLLLPGRQCSDGISDGTDVLAGNACSLPQVSESGGQLCSKIQLATILRAKGLEFSSIVNLGTDAGNCPLHSFVFHAPDTTD